MQFTAYEKSIRDAGITVDQYLGGYNSMLTILGKLKQHTPDMGALINLDRYSFIEKYSYAIPSIKALKTIAKYGPILELAAGSGYWAYELSKLGVDVVATDNDDKTFVYVHIGKYHPVEKLSAIEAVHKYPNRTILLVWPGNGDIWPLDIAKHVLSRANQTIIYVGEDQICATPSFFEFLNANFDGIKEMDIPRWCGMHDYLKVWRLKNVVERQATKDT